MGAWGAGLFSNDTAADLKQDFRDLVADGVTSVEAVAEIVAEYGVGAGGPDDHDFWLALAVTAHKLGRLPDEVRATALGIIDDPLELNRWPETQRGQRTKALARARDLLLRPQPAAKRIRKRVKVDTALRSGQHVRWHLDHGKPDVLLRVTGIHEDKGGRYPRLLALDWNGSERALRKPHRLDGLPSGPDPLSGRERALGFTALGRPSDPIDLVVLDRESDKRTPATGHRHHLWVVEWSNMHRFFTATGRAATPPEDPRRRDNTHDHTA